jgi:hypothetical protein
MEAELTICGLSLSTTSIPPVAPVAKLTIATNANHFERLLSNRENLGFR